MTVNGTTMVCGVMGCPVGHSMSPLMHNFFAEQTGLDLVYVPFPVEPGQVKAAVAGAHALNIRGINVTVPHKQAVMEAVCSLDESAKAVGAVNTLVWTEQGYRGYNTDAEGMFRAMKDAGMDIAGRVCVLLGAGGAARAAAWVLVREQAAKVYILNRSMERARQLAEEMRGMGAGRTVCVPLALEDWRQIQEKGCLAVQTTSVGMHPHEDGVPIAEPDFYEKLDMAFDAIYTPARTRFLALAEAAGARTANGLGMLIHQGAAAYELWNPDIRIPETALSEAAKLIRRRLKGEGT
ncbi:MAG: shikimate dehydrogenase [Eubacteriales bacterium]|nr:shikimate dehydrogenase [Eubacteriales bacterium]